MPAQHKSRFAHQAHNATKPARQRPKVTYKAFAHRQCTLRNKCHCYMGLTPSGISDLEDNLDDVAISE